MPCVCDACNECEATIITRRNSLIHTMFFVFLLQQSTEDASNDGREFTLMAGFPPRDLSTDMDNSIESCKLAGEAITMRWK